MAALGELLRLLWGTVLLRPYVWAFFACFLVIAGAQLRGRGTLVFCALAWCTAFAAEYSSTRNGFPFGPYVYLDATRSRELWVSNVPFWDSLSFVFLAYFSWRVAAQVRAPRRSGAVLLAPSTALLAGLLMMLLDVVIDPVALRGDQWFLGRLYLYPSPGPYFGVTLANFVGWFLVGTVTVLAFQGLCRLGAVRAERFTRPTPRADAACLGVYAGVLLFNLAVTAWIGAWTLLAAGCTVAALTLGACLLRVARPGAGAWWRRTAEGR